VRVSRSIRETDAMAASASPRKPIVPIAARSSAVRSLLVAWRRKAVSASSGLHAAAVVRDAQVGHAAVLDFDGDGLRAGVDAVFDSSLTTDAGRSTTSPAAMRSATCGES
jgi:hypothetical protein